LTELSAASVLDGLAERQLDPDQATHMVGSGTLLARTDDGQFTFVHQSVMEWLVAAEGARLLRAGERLPEVLGTRTMSPLMPARRAGHSTQRKETSHWQQRTGGY